MADKPPGEVHIDEALVRRLLLSQAHTVAGSATMALQHADDGWDCSVWRLGDRLAVRLPRRRIAAPLIVNEQRYLPSIAARVTGVGVPAPVFAGVADETFRWPWSIVPWFDGAPGITVPRARRTGWARPLAEALGQLHEPAGDHPVNPYRGVPLGVRDESIRMRLLDLRRTGTGARHHLDRLAGLWDDGLTAPGWAGPPTWIHGDLHPGNIIARGVELTALIDFGDLTAGDPAYDIAVAWLAFDATGRAAFRDATAHRYDDATWVRARAWAAAVTVLLLTQSDDAPGYAALGAECLAELAR